MLHVESRQFAYTAPAFNLPHLHLVPPSGVTSLSFVEIFGTNKLESLAIVWFVCMILCLAVSGGWTDKDRQT